MDFSQSALFFDLSFQFSILRLLISVCTQFHLLFFVDTLSLPHIKSLRMFFFLTNNVMHRILFRIPPLGSPKVHSIDCLLRHNGFLQYCYKRPLGRPRSRWDNNIKMDLQDVDWGSWTGLIWLRTGTDYRLL